MVESEALGASSGVVPFTRELVPYERFGRSAMVIKPANKWRRSKPNPRS
jgi:hypothetical protein